MSGGSTTTGSYTYHYNVATTDEPFLNSSVHGGVTTTYTYNSLDQLLGAYTGTPATSQAYTYDNNGNLLTENLGGTTHTLTYNTVNQLCWAYIGTSTNACGNAPSSAATYSYDNNGNQTTSSAGLNLTYNTQNQAASMTNATGGTITNMTHTGVGNTQRTAAGTTTFINNAFGVASSTTSGASTSCLPLHQGPAGPGINTAGVASPPSPPAERRNRISFSRCLVL